MITIRRGTERGHANHGWLDTFHTFSFADYHDPAHMNFSVLRVINEDRVAPGAGFGTHPHRDMEILTYVLEGALEHKDSMGNLATIVPGEVQRMSAGTGVLHSEYNPSAMEPVHLLQIWLMPNRMGVAPGYEQKAFAPADLAGRLRLLVSPDGRDGSLTMHQDACLYATRLTAGETVSHALVSGRRAFVHVARGGVRLAGYTLSAGDAVGLENEPALQLVATSDAEVLVFDLP